MFFLQTKNKLNRLLNKQGRLSVTRLGVQRNRLSDLYHFLLSISWIEFFGVVFAFYIMTNLIFAFGYFSCDPKGLEGLVYTSEADRFLHCFFFSVQTLATIGYGKISPVTIATNLLVTLEALVGILVVALNTGLFFSRFAKPTAKVRFSEQALIVNHDGVRSLMIRVANERTSQIIEAQVRMVAVVTEQTKEGETYRNLYPLKLELNQTPLFSMSLTIVHPIDVESILYNKTEADFEKLNLDLVVTLVGIDDTFSQNVHTRYSYRYTDFVYDKNFVDILTRNNDGSFIMNLYDFDKLT